MGEDTEEQKYIKSTKTAFDIVELLKHENGATISEIANKLNLSKSTVHGHIVTLQNHGFVVHENNQYHVGIRFLDLGTYARSRQPIYEEVKPKIDRLADETNEQAEFLIEEQGRGVYVYRAIGSHAVQIEPRVGKRRYLHTSAGGQAILSKLSKERIDEIITRWGLVEKTPHTITTRSELFKTCERIQKRGYAKTDSESIEGLRGVAAPVIHDDEVKGAICISGPSHRLNDNRIQDDLSNLLLSVANEVELRMNHADDS